MILGGRQLCTLSDYPGRVAAILFTQGCNLRCPFCHNGGLLSPQPDPGQAVDVEETLELLAARVGKISGVVVSGGEPTLHDDLPKLMARLKGIGLRVKLDTNGTRPAMLRALLAAGLLDYVAMDIKAPWERYDRLSGCHAPRAAIEESIALLAASGLPHQFRTTEVPALHAPNDMAAIRAMLPASSPHVVQTFRAGQALDAELR